MEHKNQQNNNVSFSPPDFLSTFLFSSFSEKLKYVCVFLLPWFRFRYKPDSRTPGVR
jgi:hypothetical protein